MGSRQEPAHGSRHPSAFRGITVAAAAPQAAALVTAARELLAQARRNGYHRDDLIRLIQTLPDP